MVSGTQRIRSVGSITTHCCDAWTRAKMVLGHTRAATHGAITHLNAHPFLVGQTYTAHNGIVYNCEDVVVKWAIKYDDEALLKYEVDSQLVAYAFAKNRNLMHELQGYFGVWSLTGNTLQLFRSQTGWLYYAIRPHEELVFASEREFIETLRMKPIEVPDDTVLKFDVSRIEQCGRDKLITQHMTTYTWPTTSSYYDTSAGKKHGKGKHKKRVLTEEEARKKLIDDNEDFERMCAEQESRVTDTTYLHG